MAQRIRHLRNLIHCVVGIRGFSTHLIDNGNQPIRLVILILLGVALGIRFADNVACKVIAQTLTCAVGIRYLLQQALRRVAERRPVAQFIRLTDKVAQRVIGIRGFRPVRCNLPDHASQQVVFVGRRLFALRHANDVSAFVIRVCCRQPCARRGLNHTAQCVIFG